MLETKYAPKESEAASAGKAREIKVLYIGGEGRSGSTLLARLMGEVEGCVNIGEMFYMWRPLLQNQLCGCGEPLRECVFWRQVMDDAFGGVDKIDAQRIRAVKRSIERIRTAHRLFSPIKGSRTRREMREYTDFLSALYTSLQKALPGKTIVDASKSPVYSYILSQVPGIDLRVVHLVRDSRAVSHSFQRAKLNPAIHWEEARFDTVNPLRGALLWNIQNTLMGAMRPRAGRYCFVRYEDVVKDPKTALLRLCGQLNIPAGDLGFLSEPEIQTGVQHTANGNPDRFQPTIKIRKDDAWLTEMKPNHRRLVTALTLPLLMRYGYAGARRVHQAPE